MGQPPGYVLTALTASHEEHELSWHVACVCLGMLEHVVTTLTMLPPLTVMHCVSGVSSTTLSKVVIESTGWEQVVSPAGKASRKVVPGAPGGYAGGGGGKGGSEGDESQKVIAAHEPPTLVYLIEYDEIRLPDVSSRFVETQVPTTGLVGQPPGYVLTALTASHEEHELSWHVACVCLGMLEHVVTTLMMAPPLTAMHCVSGVSSTTLSKVVIESADVEQVVSPAGYASRVAVPEAAAPVASMRSPRASVAISAKVTPPRARTRTHVPIGFFLIRNISGTSRSTTM